MHVVQVQLGTFSKLRHRMMSESGKSNVQFKVPRILRKEPELKFLISKSLSNDVENITE